MGPQSDALILPVSLCLTRGAGVGLKIRDTFKASLLKFTFCPEEKVPCFLGQQQACLNTSDTAFLWMGTMLLSHTHETTAILL